MATVTTKSTPKKKPAAQEYDSSNIQVLEGVEHVRLRPGMYIGTTSSRGLHHLVTEVVDNAVDEAMAGRATKIVVTIHADGSVSVQDDGAGIPVKPIPGAKDRRPAVEVALTTLNAGGKFGGGGYSISGGLHGVGVSVVNALSREDDGRHPARTASRGTRSTRRAARRPSWSRARPARSTGTTVRFWPDPEIFTETVEFKREQLTERLRELAFLNAGLEIHLLDEREDPVHKDVYRYNDGLDGLREVPRTAARRSSTSPSRSSQKGDDEVEVAMQWNAGYTESVYSFANTINTHEGGMHEEGLKKSLTNVINRYARAKGLLKEKEENLIGEDVREGLTAIVSVKLRDPQFEGQTKTKLGQRVDALARRDHGERAVRRRGSRSTPATRKRDRREGLAAAKARMAARQARDLTRRKSLPRVGLAARQARRLPADRSRRCASSTSWRATRPAVRPSRPATGRTQAILPIRGKILNVEKARLHKILENLEIQALITAIGTGIGDEFDLEKARYHRIVIMADADVDGAHIRTLLLTFFFRHMRELIEAGYIYVAQPPLYRVKDGKQEHYFYDEQRAGTRTARPTATATRRSTRSASRASAR